MIHAIPAANWPEELAAALRRAVRGDVILVRTDTQRELAHLAMDRLGMERLMVEVHPTGVLQ